MRQRLTLSKSDFHISHNGCMLQARGLKIKAIDQLPPQKIKHVTSLNLAHNHITKIQNINQFAALQSFDFSYNNIKNGLQLIKLSQLPKLTKVTLQGNPFLLDPLHEEVLEFLLQRQTDIDILSGEALNKMRDLHEGELKVVFLQNYLKKMNCHEEIMIKKFGRGHSSKSLVSEQNANKHIINKIMPQFYSIIDDPRLNTKLKRETIGLKRKEQVSFEQAMNKKKEKQQKQVDNLIKDILLLVEEQDQQQYHSNEVDKIQQFNKQLQGRPYQQPSANQWDTKSINIKESSIQKQLQKSNRNQYMTNSPPLNSLKRKFNRIQSRIRIEQIEQQSYFKQKYFKSPKKQTQVSKQKLMKRVQNYSVNVFSPQPEKSTEHQVNKPQYQFSSKNDSTRFYSFNKTNPIQPSKFHGQTQRKQHIQLNQNNSLHKKMEQYQSSRVRQEQQPNQNVRQQRGHDKLIIDANMDFNYLTANTSPSVLYEQYYSHLTKFNPSFALLYSQITTLSSQQKSVLIEALSKDHKQKTLQLFREQAKFKKLKEVSLDNINSYEKQIEMLQKRLDDAFGNQKLIKQYAGQLQFQNDKLAQLLKRQANQVKKIKQQSWEYHQQNLNKASTIKTLEADIQQKKAQIYNLNNYQNLYQIIRSNVDKRKRKQTLMILKCRAKQYTQIQVWKTRRKDNERLKLLNISWSLLKKHLLTQILVKMRIQQKNCLQLRKSFNSWKTDVQEAKKCKSLLEKLNQFLQSKNLKVFRKIIDNKISQSKQIKLHQFWADRQFLKAWFYRLRRKNNQIKQENQNKMKYAQNYKKRHLLDLVFKKLNQIAHSTNKNIHNIKIQKQNENKIKFFEYFKKLHTNKLVIHERKNKFETIGLIFKFQIQNKRKSKAIKNIMKQNEQIKVKCKKITNLKKSKVIISLIKNMKQINKMYELKNKTKFKLKQLNYKRFIRNGKSCLQYRNITKKFFARYIKHKLYQQSIIQSKQTYIQNNLRNKRIKQVYYSLMRNMYNQKLFNIEVQQRVQSQQTQQLIQKIKMLENMQIESIKNEHIKQLHMIQEEDIQKQLNYRSSLAVTENEKKELEDVIKLLKNQIQGFRGREGVFYKQKNIMEEQINFAEKARSELANLNQNLRIQITNINTKYERMLQIYTQTVIDLERKQKQQYNSGQRQRNDRTVEKEKRQTGVAKNGQIVSLRNRIF